MAINFITATEITGLSAGAWTNVAAPGAVPAGATGVFGYILNNNATYTTWRQCGVRHTSDTSRTTLGDEPGNGRATFFCVGLDGSDEFDYYVENATDNELWITGYFDDEASFKTAAVDYSFSKAAGWQRDEDLTTDTAADATAVIIQVTNSVAGRAWGAQSADDTADVYNDRGRISMWAIVPMATGQLIDLRSEDASCTVHILGHLTGGVVDATYSDETPTSDSTWTAVTSPSADAEGVLCCVVDDSNSTNNGEDWGARERGASAYSWFPGEAATGAIALVPLDSNADWENYATDVVADDTSIWQMATFKAAAGVTITDVNTTESWDDGDTGLVITGTGFV